MSGGKAFFDTNILVYMHSTADLKKQSKAHELYQKHVVTNGIVLSTQVIQEFYVVALRKLRLPREEVLERITALLGLDPLIVGPTHIRAAMDIEERYKIVFWDALILAAAESANVEVLYSEDLNDGQRYGGVLVQNPFLN